MREIKIRYRLQHLTKNGLEEWFEYHTLQDLERCSFVNSVTAKVIARDLYTGLKDKNNIVDVYEGDITIDGVIEFNQDVCGYIIRRSNNTFIRLETRRKTLEIIGNIYEHPQLIDNQK